MGNLYENIQSLCQAQDIRPGRLCADTGLSRGLLSDLKAGRTKTLSAKNMQVIADFFGVSVEALLGEPAPRQLSREDIKFALFGGDGEITDEMYDEVLQFAAYVKQRKKKE